MEAVEKEILADHSLIDAATGNVDDRMEDDTTITTEAPVDPSPSNPA